MLSIVVTTSSILCLFTRHFDPFLPKEMRFPAHLNFVGFVSTVTGVTPNGHILAIGRHNPEVTDDPEK